MDASRTIGILNSEYIFNATRSKKHAYERLIKILSLYRLTLGQARQEELLEYIFDNCESPEEMKDLFNPSIWECNEVGL